MESLKKVNIIIFFQPDILSDQLQVLISLKLYFMKKLISVLKNEEHGCSHFQQK